MFLVEDRWCWAMTDEFGPFTILFFRITLELSHELSCVVSTAVLNINFARA